MESLTAGSLVGVATAGPVLDGIVFRPAQKGKIVVALVDAVRGPVLRSVDVATVSAREADGPADKALRMLIRRSPPGVSVGGVSAASANRASAGHTRTAMHRPTGK